MLRFGTQYVYCPNEVCIAHTKEFRAPLLVESVARTASDSIIHNDKTWAIKCPYCRCHLLQCDNCFALIMGPNSGHTIFKSSGKEETSKNSNENSVGGKVEKKLAPTEFTVCLECGFINVFVPSIRKKLLIKPIWPLDFATVRFIQKCICGDELHTIQNSPTEPTTQNSSLTVTTNPNSNSTQNLNLNPTSNSNLNSNSVTPSSISSIDSKKRPLITPSFPSKKSKIDPPPSSSAATSTSTTSSFSTSISLDDRPKITLKNQTAKLQEIARAETKTLESISFWNSCHKFSNSHLLMLQALYQRDMGYPSYEKLFAQATSFVKEHMDIIRVKLQCEAALKVWDRLKFSDSYATKSDGNAISKPSSLTTDNKTPNSTLEQSNKKLDTQNNNNKNNNSNNNTNNNNNANNNNKINNSNTNKNTEEPIKHATNANVSNSEDISVQQSQVIVANILWARYDRLRRRLQFCTKPYIFYLVDINTELMQLYAKLHSILTWQAQHSTTPFLGVLDTSRERFEKEEQIMEITNKIVLWRLFYKTISVCVL